MEYPSLFSIYITSNREKNDHIAVMINTRFLSFGNMFLSQPKFIINAHISGFPSEQRFEPASREPQLHAELLIDIVYVPNASYVAPNANGDLKGNRKEKDQFSSNSN